MVKILVFGDSITWGAFDLESGGWVERLKTVYMNMRPEVKYYVYNFGVSSNDTRGVLFELEKRLEIIEKIEPDDYIFVFSIGSNDCRYIKTKENKFVPIDEFESNLKKIISLTRKYSEKIIFTGFLEVDESKTKPWLEDEFWENDDLEEYDKKLKGICKSENIGFIPFLNLLTKEDLHDGLHPNSKGHRKIFERVKEELNEILKVN